VGAASWERPDNGRDEEQGGAGAANSVTSADRPPDDAVRSWLVRGIHTFGVDPRRLGGRGHARRVLGEDRGSAPRGAGGWRELASALQRHTLHNALTQLSAAERQVVTLAYLEGRTNRQIAAILGMSVSTVRRRLWFALDHLDEYVRRTGTWVSSILLLGLVYVIDRSARLGRLANSAASAQWPHKLAATVVVGSAAAAGFGLVAVNLHSSTSKPSLPPATARLIPSLPETTKSSSPSALPIAPTTVAPITATTAGPPSATATATKASKGDSDTTDEQTGQKDSRSDRSDEGNRTSPVTVKAPLKSRLPREPRQRRVVQESSH
jgi:hypothetical protein